MDENLACKNCGAAPEAGGYELSLCARCRSSLAHRPFPAWIKVSSGVALLTLLFAISILPSTFNAGIAFERGRRAESARDYSLAAAEYQRVVTRFPDSTLALARLGINRLHAGQLPEAAAAFQKLGGRKTSKELAVEVNAAIDELDHKFKEQ